MAPLTGDWTVLDISEDALRVLLGSFRLLCGSLRRFCPRFGYQGIIEKVLEILLEVNERSLWMFYESFGDVLGWIIS